MVTTILQLIGSSSAIEVAFFVLTLVVLVLFLLLSERTLKRIKNLLDILDNGSYHSCPFFSKCAQSGGRRWYDNLEEKEGGETL